MTSIDTTEFVEVEHGTLKFENETQQAKFELGVCMAVYKWDELATAVENSWGGANSAEKRDWISGIVIDLFTESKAVDVQLIEETLLYAMVDEFDTEVDNDSALEIAALVMKFYKEVAERRYNLIDELYAKWLEKGQNKSSAPVKVEEDPNNPDSDDDDDEEEEEEEEEEQRQHIHSSGDAMEVDTEPSSRNQPIVDDDGFELVTKGRRR
ncbi:rRNA accumulation- protein [Lodderomyces elongisporus]|uniref:rRNA accumulation- protein n=1 Tax=Lodderomyces elongisporus TaxID=36914 RepID=UPI00292309CC|nr:rRNA accumulation- protein [Lodderomyces elongisporus]WLF77609.1 rRNA accumulation- protein [Lodderomyces elongisporus]